MSNWYWNAANPVHPTKTDFIPPETFPDIKFALNDPVRFSELFTYEFVVADEYALLLPDGDAVIAPIVPEYTPAYKEVAVRLGAATETIQ